MTLPAEPTRVYIETHIHMYKTQKKRQIMRQKKNTCISVNSLPKSQTFFNVERV